MKAKWKFLVGGAAVTLIAMVTGAHASTTLTFSSWIPPQHPLMSKVILPWTKQVEAATKGNVTVRILAKGLGHPSAHFDIAKGGLADVTFSVHGYTPGRFLATQAAEMPFLGNSAEAISVAYWRIHNKFLAPAKEHSGVQLLSVFTHGPGHIFNSKRAISKLADLQGLKMRIGGGVIAKVAKNLDVAGLSSPATKSYEMLSNGVADGIFFPHESVGAFKIAKFVPYATEVPGGLYNTSFFLVMNKAKFAGLSASDQKSILNVSGEAFARMAGKMWDMADQRGIGAQKKAGTKIQKANAELIGQLKNAAAPIEKEWVEKVQKRGIDGAAVLKALRGEIAALEK